MAIDQVHGHVEYLPRFGDHQHYKITLTHRNTTYSVTPGYYQDENPDSSDDNRVRFKIEIRLLLEWRSSPGSGYIYLWSDTFNIHFSLRFLNWDNEDVDPPFLHSYDCSVEDGDPINFETKSFPNVVVEHVGVSDVSAYEGTIKSKVREAGFTRCEIQRDIVEAFDPFFGANRIEIPGVEIPGDFDFYFRDIWMSAGDMLVSDEHLFFRLPCVPTRETGPNGGPGCTNIVPEGYHGCEGMWKRTDLAMAFMSAPGRLMDFPKVVDYYLKTDDMYDLSTLYNLHVTCNHGNDCSETGDSDGDGFCDDIDFCLGMVTGANCDHDGDGFGGGAFTEGCRILDRIDYLVKEYELESPWESEKHRMQIAQLLCGGCDNCPLDYNPSQFDLDGDGLGDACDPDIDGDGIRNEYDCNKYNPFVGADRDNDGVCDEYMDVVLSEEFTLVGNYENCINYCEYAKGYYGLDFNLSWCKETCTVDNCITQYYKDDVYDKLCSHIDHCISVGATLNEESCSPNGPDNYPYLRLSSA